MIFMFFATGIAVLAGKSRRWFGISDGSTLYYRGVMTSAIDQSLTMVG